MELTMNPELARGYKSRSQMTRVISEDWGARNLYCISCEENSLIQAPANTRAFDYICDHCKSRYQLKSSSRLNESRVPDAGYEAMAHAIKSDLVPNLFILQYSENWAVLNLLLVPYFFFSISALEKRKPLAPTARRSGWIGCNILLSSIAPEGKIRIVKNGSVVDPGIVRQTYESVRPLSKISADLRGWTLDVFKLVRDLGRPIFTLGDA